MHWLAGHLGADRMNGTRFRTASRTVTETDLVSFLNLAGFTEPLFLDARHAAEASFAPGGRLVPGALTFCIALQGIFPSRN